MWTENVSELPRRLNDLNTVCCYGLFQLFSRKEVKWTFTRGTWHLAISAFEPL